jgi:hypothetical protein
MSEIEELNNNLSNINISYNLEKINSRIKNEVCLDTIDKISDLSLIDEYKNSKSTIDKVNLLENILEKNNINENIKKNIIEEFILNLVSPGTKGVIRGNKFNKLIKDYINNLNFLKNDNYEINYEKNHDKFKTSEIPDWYIFNKKTNKIIIGMNQIDLWSGGHQTNRGSKYITDFDINKNKNLKLLCVICNNITIKNEKNKNYKLFKKGFEENTICYIKNLENIIREFLN